MMDTRPQFNSGETNITADTRACARCCYDHRGARGIRIQLTPTPTLGQRPGHGEKKAEGEGDAGTAITKMPRSRMVTLKATKKCRGRGRQR